MRVTREKRSGKGVNGMTDQDAIDGVLEFAREVQDR